MEAQVSDAFSSAYLLIRNADKAVRRSALEIVAMQLFATEQNDNPLVEVDRRLNWHQITSSDRHEYRKLAATLLEEKYP